MQPPKKQLGATEQERTTLWLILGPSGSGKSSFGKWLAAERNWLHLEVDRYPEGDGIDLLNLRAEWNEFYEHGNPKGLGEAVQRRLGANSKARGVLTFPGNLVLSPDRVIAASQKGIRTICLYGSAAHCITAFLNREQETGRNLDLGHWIAHNRISYMQMSEPVYAPYRIHVFTHTGVRRQYGEVFEDAAQG